MRLATEFISHQEGNLGTKFDIIFQNIIDDLGKLDKDVKGNTLYKSIPAIKLLEDTVFNRFGIKVRYNHSNKVLMAVLPMFVNKFHIFLNDALHGFKGIKSQETILKGLDGKKGYVDLENAKVSGIFSTYDHLLFMNLPLLINFVKLNARELSGVLLHEIGHLFNNYEFANRIESTNEVLLNLSNELKNGNDAKKIEIIYKQYLDLTNSKEDIDLFTSGKTRVIIGATLFKKHFQYVRSQWHYAKNDETGSEVSADVFSARLGYGNDLIKALDKIGKTVGSTNEFIRVFNIITLINYIAIPCAGISLILLMGAIGWAILLSVWCSVCLLWASDIFGADNLIMTYDTIKVRYIKIREQYIDLIKNSDLPTVDAQHILEQIYSIDVIIKNTKEYSLFFTKIGNVLFSKHRTAANDITLQRLIEELAHNELFLKSAELNIAIKGA